MLYELKLSSSLHKCLRQENFWRMTVKDKHHKDSVAYIYWVDVFRGRLHESRGGFGDYVYRGSNEQGEKVLQERSVLASLPIDPLYTRH